MSCSKHPAQSAPACPDCESNDADNLAWLVGAFAGLIRHGVPEQAVRDGQAFAEAVRKAGRPLR